MGAEAKSAVVRLVLLDVGKYREADRAINEENFDIAVVEGSALPEADVGERFRKDWCHILCRDSEIEQAALNAIPRSERINECAGRPMLLFFGSTQVVQALLNQGFGGRIEIVDRLSQE